MAYSALVTIPAGAVSEALTGFVVRIDLATMPAGWWADVDSAGAGIRVRQDGVDLPRDLVTFDKVTSTGLLYTRVPTLATGGTVLDVVTTAEAAPAHTDPLGRHAVWADYEVMFDFWENVDRTGKHGPVVATETAGFTLTTGRMILTTQSGGKVAGVPKFTTWTMGLTGYKTGTGQGSAMSYGTTSGTRTSIGVRSGTSWQLYNSSNSWLGSGVGTSRVRVHHTQQEAVTRRIYVDGAEKANGGTAQRPGSPGDALYFGTGYEGAESPGTYWPGEVERAYLRNGELSAGWLAAEQASWEGSTFYTVTDGGGGGTPSEVAGSINGTAPAVSGAFAGTASASEQPVSGTLGGTAPGASAAFAGTVTAKPVTGTVAATSPLVTGAFVGDLEGVVTGSLVGQAPAVFAELAGDFSGDALHEATTDAVDRSNGRTRVCEWTVEVEPPVTSPTRDRGHDYAIAVSISGTTLDDGRPT